MHNEGTNLFRFCISACKGLLDRLLFYLCPVSRENMQYMLLHRICSSYTPQWISQSFQENVNNNKTRRGSIPPTNPSSTNVLGKVQTSKSSWTLFFFTLTEYGSIQPSYFAWSFELDCTTWVSLAKINFYIKFTPLHPPSFTRRGL